ncbi:MAG: DUF4234 domain-containing protein [Leptospirales bacterium]|nr:DUF4234 domain-containing protein [Leptospirales bacterium]
MSDSTTERPSPVFVIVLSIVTCGIYLFFWYYRTYEDLGKLCGRTPTGNGYWMDLLLTVVTFGLWSVYVDYTISERLNEMQQRASMPENDTRIPVVILDVAGIVTGYLTGVISCAIHQDQINKAAAALQAAGLSTPPAKTAAEGGDAAGSNPWGR